MNSHEARHDTGKYGAHFFYDWQGSPYEIGLQHGEALREEIVREYNPNLQEIVKQSGRSEEAILDEIVTHYEPVFEKYTPSAIEEIHGIADGSGLSYKHAFFAATRDGMKTPVNAAQQDSGENCTAFFCAPEQTARGRVLIGQTKDTGAPLDRYRIMRRSYSSGLRVLSLNYPGWIANIGINSYGVACTANSLYAQPAQAATVPFVLVRRLMMEKSSTVEVLDTLQYLRLENCCMMVADASGHAVCIESAAGRRDVRDVSGQAFAHANSILSPELQPLEDKVLGSPSSPIRQKNAQRLLDEKLGALSPNTMQHILSDHTNFPLSICRHASTDDPAMTTTAAFIADLNNLEMHIAIGNPCVAPFQTYRV